MLTTQTNVVRYSITPTVTSYDFAFPFWDFSQIVVTVSNASGDPVELTRDVDYTLTVSEPLTDPVYQDGTITMISDTYRSYQTLIIARELEIEQDTQYPNGSPINGSTIESSLDKLVAMIQQVNEENVRAIKLPESEDTVDLVLPPSADRTGKVLGFDETGNLIVMYPNPQAAVDAATAAEEAASAAASSAGDASSSASAAAQASQEAQQAADEARQIAEDIDLENINNKFEELEQDIENVQNDIVLPIPAVEYIKYAAGDSGIVKLSQNWVGYAGVTVRAKVDADPTAEDAVIDPTAGLVISTNGTWHIRSFPTDGTSGKPSPSVFVDVAGLKVQAPSISYDVGSRTVTITCPTSGASIRYTTDGSEPSESNGTAYSAPFTISTNVTVKAKAFKAGIDASDAVERLCVVVRVYGVVWNRNNDSTKLTRLTPETDPFNLVTETIATEPVAAKNASEMGSSPMDGTNLWGQMRMRNITGTTLGPWEGEDGFSLSTADVMVKLPDNCYYTIKNVESDGQKLRYYIVGDGYISGLAKHPGSGKYIARYFTNNNHKSVTGGAADAQFLGTHRNYAAAKGTGWHQQGIVERCLVDLLYIVEYADWNSQQVIGNGNTASQQGNGGTDAMAYHTGINGTTCQYRHIENLWGYYEWVDGILFQNGQIRICKDYAKFSDSITSDYEQFGFTYSSNIGDGYIKDFAYDEDEPWLFIVPSVASGGSSTTYVPDYGYLYYSSSVCALYVGNTGGSGAGNGLFRFYGSVTPSGNLASRLVYEEPSAA